MRRKARAMEVVTVKLDPDEQPDTEVNLVELAVGHWLYWVQFAEANAHTYNKVLVPLDRTRESEMVLPRTEKFLDSEGEGILLHVILPEGIKPQNRDRYQPQAGEEDEARTAAINYLQEVKGRLGDSAARWRCDVIRAPTVADGIADYAVQEEVDLIAMYTHDRKGLAKLIKGNIADKIRNRTPVELKLFRSRDLAPR